MTYDERQLLFKRCKSYLNGGEYPIGWFQPSADVKRENVILWILWALFSTESYQPEWEEEINEYLSEVESLLGCKLDGGFNEKAKSMRLTFDPVVMLHRPLVWYFVSFSLPYRNAHHLIHCPCVRLSGVWIFTRRYPFVVVDFIIMPPLDGFGAFHLAPKLFYRKNQSTLIYHTGTVPISQQRNCLYCSFMVSGYGHSLRFSQSQTNQSVYRSVFGPTSPFSPISSTRIPTSVSS